jgi:sugar transferase (PEP-CTERM/EpsH1 system associated)
MLRALVADVVGSMTVRPLVAHVIHSLAVGGLENGVVNLVNNAGGEFQHVIVCMSKGGAMRKRVNSEVEVVEIDKRPGNDVRALLRLVRTFRHFRPAIVHSRNWAAFDAVPAARVAGVRRVVHSEHGREFGDPDGRNRHRNRIRRTFSPLVTHFITVSRELRTWLTDEVGIRREKVSTIYNGVDVGRFGPVDRGAARARFGLPRDGSVIGTVGRLDPVKDQAALVHAFAKLRADHPDSWLLIVGDGPYREELTRVVRECGVEDRVRLAGELPDIPVALAAMDVFALPSIAEGMSNTLLEAMASSLPAVATRVGGTPELLEDGKTGRLIERGDRAALAKVLGEYLEDGELRLAHGRAARQWVAKHFGLDRMCRDYLDVYRGVLAGRCGKAA